MLQWEGAVGAAATLAEGPGANILLSTDTCRERWGKRGMCGNNLAALTKLVEKQDEKCHEG